MDRKKLVVGTVVAIPLAVFAGWMLWPDPELDIPDRLREVIVAQGFQAIDNPVSDLRPGDIHPPEIVWRGCWVTAELQATSLGGVQQTISYDRRASIRQALRLLRSVELDMGADARRVRELRLHATDWRVARGDGFAFAWERPDCWDHLARKTRLSVVGRTLIFGSMRIEALDSDGQQIAVRTLAGIAAPHQSGVVGDASALDRHFLSGDSLVVGIHPHLFQVRTFECSATVAPDARFTDIEGCPRWDGETGAWYRVRVESEGPGDRVAIRAQEVAGFTTTPTRHEAELGLEIPLTTHALRHDRMVVRRQGAEYAVAIQRYELQPDEYVGYHAFAAAARDTVGPVELEAMELLALRVDTAFGELEPDPAVARPLPDRFAVEPFRTDRPDQAVIRPEHMDLLCDPTRRAPQSPGLCARLDRQLMTVRPDVPR